MRGWVLLCGCAAAGVLVGVVAKNWLAGSGAGVVSAVVSIVATRARADLDVRSKRNRQLSERVVISTERGGLRKVRELPDAVAFRVHPAAILERSDGQFDRLPPYVRRDMDALMDRVLVGTGFVLLIGESTAGKTRTAFEAISRKLPDHVFVAPNGHGDLDDVIGTVLEHRRCVVWLDELDRFLGPDGLSTAKINRMLGDGSRHVVIMATIRTTSYDRYSPREEAKADGGTRELLQAGRDVLRVAHRFDLSRRWTEAELGRAREFVDDSRLRAAIEQAGEFGVGEVLAAGPQLLADWQHAWTPGRHPRGAAIVAAAIDCQRTGVTGPVSERTLRHLHEHYLTARTGGSGLQPESFEDGLAWAVDPVPETTSSLLIHTNGSYRAFDYLVDTVTDPVPAKTWQILLARATPHDSYDIGITAYRQGRFDHAEAGLAKAAASGIAEAQDALARCVGDAGRPAEAASMFATLAERRATKAGPGDPQTLAVRRQYAVYIGLSGKQGRAIELLAQLTSDCTSWLGRNHVETLTTRYERATHLGLSGDLRGSTGLLAGLITDCTAALGVDHPITLKVRYQYANSVGTAGQLVRAAALLEALIQHRTTVLDAADDPDTLLARHQHATYLGRAGQLHEATELFAAVVADRNRVLGRWHPDTFVSRHQHATYRGMSGAYQEAADLFAELAADYQTVMGAGHAETLIARYQHGASLAAAKRLPEAVRCLVVVLVDCNRELGADHDLTTIVTTALNQWRPRIES